METINSNLMTIDLLFGHLTVTPKVEERLEELDFTPESLKTAIESHKAGLSDNPKVYCGTYYKYNCGSIRGLWVDISTFDCYDDFIDFCNAIHADEDDPELMFQDYECFPEKWYCESCPDEEWFKNIKQYIELCDCYRTDAVDAFIEWEGAQMEDFDDCYLGSFDSEEDFARLYVEKKYDLESKMGELSIYFDYESYARDLFKGEFYYSDGYVFRYS